MKSKKHKKNFWGFELYWTTTVCITGCVSIPAFASLVGIPVGFTGSAVGLKICVIYAGNKK